MAQNGVHLPSGEDDHDDGDREYAYGTDEYPFATRVERDAAIRDWSIQRVPVPEIARRAGLTPRRVSSIRSAQRARLSLQDRAAFREEIVSQTAAVTERLMGIVMSPGAPIVKTLSGGEGGSDLVYVREPEGEDGEPGAVARDVSGPVQAARAMVQAHRSLATLLGLDAPTKIETEGTSTVRYEIVGIDPEDLT